jgi:hypothetical protein
MINKIMKDIKEELFQKNFIRSREGQGFTEVTLLINIEKILKKHLLQDE